MNLVTQNRKHLEFRNYVRQANGEGQRLDFSYRKLSKYQQKSGGDFSLILFGDPDIDDDYIVFPYVKVGHVFTLATLEPGSRMRWHGRITNMILHINHCPFPLDIRPFRGNYSLFQRALQGPSPTSLEPDEADDQTKEEDDFLYQPASGDMRKALWHQIKVRRGQKKFRDGLRKRYGDQCMISGCPLLDILEAAHIKSYRGEVDNHLSNGLLLRADLHTLFDLDLLGIEPETLIVRIPPHVLGAGYREFEGVALRCSGTRPSSEALEVRWNSFRAGMENRPAAELGSGAN